MEMENKIKVRTVARRQFSKLANNFEILLKETKIDSTKRDLAEASYNTTKNAFTELKNCDSEVKQCIIQSTTWDESLLEKEMDEVEKYRFRWETLEVTYKSFIRNSDKQLTTPNQSERKFKLPMLELQKFDGNIKNWLLFWGQYKRIHEDSSIENSDKLQYLTQFMAPNTEVKMFVESFPLTNESYNLCLTELKSRYAREDVLIQIYVRELLNLILKKENNVTKLYDNLNSHLRSLEALNVTKEKYAAFLLPMVESALPTEILKAWERARPVGTTDELTSLLEFLKKEVESNQRIDLANQFKFESRSSEPAATCLAVHSTSTINQRDVKCIWCDKPHASTECYRLCKMTLNERREFLKKKKACALCLKIGHHAKVCKNYIKCYVCGQRHSPVLCPGNSSLYNVDKKMTTQAISSYSQTSSTTLLQTVSVTIRNGQRTLSVRAMFDSGSQRSYIKEEIMEKLNISPKGTESLEHSLFGGNTVSYKKYNVYDVCIVNINKSFQFNMVALGQSIICKYVPKINAKSINISVLLDKHNIQLTDGEGESSDTDIGILIGADYSGLLLTSNIIQLGEGLTAIHTKLGWTIQGKINDAMVNTSVVTSLFCSQTITDFWNLELLGIQDPVQIQTKQEKEEEIMYNFEETVLINHENRYEVQLPWKTGYDDLQSNREIALRRLQSATNKLITGGKFYDYNKVLHEWEQTGIIECVPEPDSRDKIHYLPHRAVYKETSLTTKLRPVFDASTKDKKGKSLNACLEKGINFLDKIPDLLIGFRKGCIGITADIAKAFLQISLNPKDRDYLRFFWWKDEARHDIMEYRHCRVVFGLTSSPFLLSATILHHLKKIKGNYKGTAKILANSFYVDNLVTSLDSKEDAMKFIQEAKDIMNEGKFDLRMWVTSPLKINETKQDIVSVLGLLWDTTSDELFCNLSSLPSPSDVGVINKRSILSLTQKIFDPVGILCPVTLVPRLILQDAWNRKLSWDQDLPADLIKQFNEWYYNIHLLTTCRIPRRLSVESLQNCNDVTLHMFCDASKDGYAACVFLRTESNEGIVTIRLVCAKSRISPPEKVTIPRLELLAALIGSRLIKVARSKFNTTLETKEFCWSDSGVTLSWIKRQLDWNTYIGNRVREIRQNTNINDWQHISGCDNWADLPSRGCSPRQLLESRWWEGPSWLLQRPELWPQSTLVIDENEVKNELKKSAVVTICCEGGVTGDLLYFSKYSMVVRMLAWILRFIYNIRNKHKKRHGELLYEECEEAEKKIIMIIQNESKEFIEKHTKKLITFEDKNKLIRIKTKLVLTDFPEDVKYPVILPAKNVIIQRMVEQRHTQLLHAGTNMMITDLRKRFWIIGIRRLVKSVIDKCIICKRHRAKPTLVSAAPLPLERIQMNAPFEATGVDLAGPIYLRDGSKSWIVVYTCAVYRAVHLELSKALSTEAFMMTLRRFIARRGRPHIIISDNGTNFTGTKNLLSTIDWNEVQRQSTIIRIKWKLNAPTAAWWGGFFERIIKIIKNLLRRVLGKSTVSYEEMETLLCDCEAVVNDRPLTYVEGDNVDSFEPLRPSYFLQPITETQVTDLDLIDSKNCNRRLQYLQRLREDFRQRFKTEYLTELVQRGKEHKSSIKIGDVVLIETDERRVKWPMGLVVEIFAGRDGVNRTAKVKTSTGYKTRPFQRLYQLELSSSEVEGSAESVGKITQKELSAAQETVAATDGLDRRTDKTTRSGRVVRLPSRFKI